MAQIPYLIDGLGEFDSSTFAPTPGMNLRLDHPPTGTGLLLYLGRSLDRFIRGFG
jgi:hypothetical protein